MSDSLWPHGLQPTRLLRQCDFPGKSPGGDCHFLPINCSLITSYCKTLMASNKTSSSVISDSFFKSEIWDRSGWSWPGILPSSRRWTVAWGEQKLKQLGRVGTWPSSGSLGATLGSLPHSCWFGLPHSRVACQTPYIPAQNSKASVSENKAECTTLLPTCWEVSRCCFYHSPLAEAVIMSFPGSRVDDTGSADLSASGMSKSHCKKSKRVGRQACGYLLQRPSASEKNSRRADRQISFVSSERGDDSLPASCLGPWRAGGLSWLSSLSQQRWEQLVEGHKGGSRAGPDAASQTSCCPEWRGDPLDCSPPGSSVHGILQARTVEGVAKPFSMGSSQPRDRTWVSGIAYRFFTAEPPGKPCEKGA